MRKPGLALTLLASGFVGGIMGEILVVPFFWQLMIAVSLWSMSVVLYCGENEL